MRRFWITLVAVVLAGPACGDDDRLTAEEFLSQANARCAEFLAEDQAAADEFFGSGEPTPEQAAEFILESALPRVRELLDDLDDLAPPEDLEADVDALLEEARAAVDELERRAEQDPAELFSGDDPFAEVDARALELGIDECVESD